MSTLPYFPSPASPELLNEGEPAVQLVAAGPARQQRLTVLFRLLMLFPHGLALIFLAFGAFWTVLVGWWAALFTGRLPQWAQTYLSGFVRWITRVQAYALLLTDVWPAFSFDDEPGYPVRILVPPRERLNRVAVFFRFILAIPVYVLASILWYGGGSIVAFIAWLITLITGRLPVPLHQAYTAMLRFQARTTCYCYLLTPTYPSGLYGDGRAAPVAQGGPTDLPPFDVPGADAPDADEPAGYGAAVGDAAPADWRLLLTTGARRLLTLFIVLGAVLYFGYYFINTAIDAALVNNTRSAYDQVKTTNTTLTTQLSSWEKTMQACTDISCVNTADAQAATDFSVFASTLHGVSMPAAAVGPANQLYSEATTISQDLTKLSHATSTAEYQSLVASTGIQQALNQFDSDESALGSALGNGS